MLETDALQRVVQLDVHAQVVAVELEFVAGADAAVFVDVERELGDFAVKAHAPVFVLVGSDLVLDAGVGLGHVCHPYEK
jgi:hypothetical protein